jgi:hypothetical protein
LPFTTAALNLSCRHRSLRKPWEYESMASLIGWGIAPYSPARENLSFK